MVTLSLVNKTQLPQTDLHDTLHHVHYVYTKAQCNKPATISVKLSCQSRWNFSESRVLGQSSKEKYPYFRTQICLQHNVG